MHLPHTIAPDRASPRLKSLPHRLGGHRPVPLQRCQSCALGRVEKWRHWVPHAGHEWEVDEFLGANAGLIVAELELEDEAEVFVHPSWLGAEVTHDGRYFNSWLATHPWPEWRATGSAP